VVTLTSTTFTSTMIVYVPSTSWTFVIVTNFPWNIFCILTNFWQSIILCPFKRQMWHAYEDVFYAFWLGCATSMVVTVVSSFFFLHVSTLWFVNPQFVQCLSISLILLCVFTITTYLILYGIDNALLVSTIVIISSHNIVASICYCNVDRFIPEVTILSYDYKPILNIVVRKLSMVGTCKPWTSFQICS
jgi:hypothetical protein